MVNKIKQELVKVIKAGYGDTIELKINGEYYEINYPKSMERRN